MIFLLNKNYNKIINHGTKNPLIKTQENYKKWSEELNLPFKCLLNNQLKANSNLNNDLNKNKINNNKNSNLLYIKIIIWNRNSKMI